MGGHISDLDQAVINRIWSQTLLEELTRFGVEQVCVAPGSRSTPLTLEADENAKLTLHTHFDERGLGFLALGLAKASAKPVAVIVTSGTAVANLLPAITEAKLTGEKLVILTADRPVELVDCGANQAINQVGIFENHVTAQINLPSPTLSVSLSWLLTSIDDAMNKQAQSGSAIHINCPFPEPLYSSEDKSKYQIYLDDVDSWWSDQAPYTDQRLNRLHSAISAAEFVGRKGVIIVGSVPLKEAQKAQKLAEKLGWPLLADPQSGVSSSWAHYDLWLQSDTAKVQLSSCELIIQFGARIISKRLNQWILEQVKQAGAAYHYVSPSCDRNNQSHLRQSHHVSDISAWIEGFESTLPSLNQTHFGWADDIKLISSQVSQLAQLHLSTDSPLSEIGLALSLSSIPSSYQLFLGNSLFVRLVDMFTAVDGVEVLTNRGASGIDGLIATAAGVARGSHTPTLVQIGDTALLYDLNSLALFTRVSTPVVILVTNNDGGAIFGLLPVPENQKQALYQMPHGYDFKSAAAQFHLQYSKPETFSEYVQTVEQHLNSGKGTMIVEVQTPPDQASHQLKEFIQQVHAL